MTRITRRGFIARSAVALGVAPALLAACAAPAAPPPPTATSAPAPAPSGSQPKAAAPSPTAAPAAPKYKTMSLRLAHINEVGSLVDDDANDFAKRIADKSGGAIKVQVFPASQLGKQLELAQQIQLGTLELNLVGSEFMSIIEEATIFDLPAIFADRAAVKKVVEGDVGKIVADLAIKKDLVVFGYWENGYRVVTNSKRPIRTPSDLAGLKLRVPPTPSRMKMFQMWGANPGPLAFSEVFTALQTGVFDGQENPYHNIISAKFYEVQKYLSETNHVYSLVTPAFSPIWFNKLDNDTKNLLRETVLEIGDASRARGTKVDEAGRKNVESKGMLVNTDVDVKAFRDAAADLFTDYEKQFGATGKSLMDALMKATG